MTGEASVIPNRSSSSELHSPITIDSQFPTTQKILTTSYDQEEESRFPKFKIPRLSLSRPEGSWTEIPRADWSERVLSAWCYGEAGDKDIEEDGDTDAVRRLRYVTLSARNCCQRILTDVV